MFRRFTLLIPDGTPGWEAWSSRSATSLVRLGSMDTPVRPDKSRQKLIVALPSQACRTLALRIPSRVDAGTGRQLALAQLEKRGLAAAVPELTAFACHPLVMAGGGAILSVDVVGPETTIPFTALNPAGLLPSGRCYALPDGPLVIVEEQGRLVLWAGHCGTLVHSHIISAAREKTEELAAEVRLTSLFLRQQKLLPVVTGLELWGAFSEAEASSLRAALPFPVNLKPRPAPDPAAIVQLSSHRLLPGMGRAARQGRRLHSLKWAALAALLVVGLVWGVVQRRSLAALEDRASQLAETLESTAGTASREKELRDRARASQERWQGLRMALEPRRYPMIHLNLLSRCLGDGNIMLSRFESKGPDLAVSGTAPSAMDAYSYYSTIGAEPGLRIYEWSMVQPVLAADGRASFQIKGKMR